MSTASSRSSRQRCLLPLVVSLITLTVTVVLWQALLNREHTHIAQMTALTAKDLQAEVAGLIRARILTLKRMAKRWEAQGGTPKPLWEADARQYTDHQSGYRAIVWVDAALRVRWGVSAQDAAATQRLDLTASMSRWEALKTARERRDTIVSRTADPEGKGTELLVHVPLFRGEAFDGVIVGVLDLQTTLNFFQSAGMARRYAIAVFDGQEEVYGRYDTRRQYEQLWGREMPINLDDMAWRLRVWPKPELVAEARSALPAVVLGIGSALAALLALIVHITIIARQRAAEMAAINQKLLIQTTGRVRAEKQFRTLLAFSPDALILVDKTGQIIQVNQQTEQLFGYDDHQLAGRPLSTLIPERFRERHAAHVATYFATPRTRLMGSGFTLFGLHKDGYEFPVEVSIGPFEGDAEVAACAAVRDVTERMLTEEALRDSEARYRAIFEGAGIGIAQVDPRGRPIISNPALQRMLGYTAAELRTMVFTDFTHPDDVDTNRARYQELMAGQRDHFELEKRYYRKDGQLIWGHLTVSSVRDDRGNPSFAISMVDDVTAHKMAVDSLKRSEARFRHLVEGSIEGICVIRHAKLLFANQAFAAMHGYDTPEAILDLDSKWSLIAPQERERLRVYQNARMRGEESPTRYTYQGMRQDGSLIWLELLASVIDWEGEPATLATTIDITDRKEAEDALTLQTRELTRSNAELEQFAYVASHDLQEPLRKVANYTRLLSQRYQGQFDDKADKYIAYIIDGATRMQRLIQDLLTYSRVGRGGIALEPTDMEAVMKETLCALDMALRDSGARVTHDPLPIVMAHPSQMRQLLQNLIGNAVKFRGEAPSHVQVSAEPAGKTWAFAVKDNGIGIEPQYAERIFAVFQRLHTRDAYPGTGIGLAICKKIVEGHGGRIWVESQPGEGTTFRFTLPNAEHCAVVEAC